MQIAILAALIGNGLLWAGAAIGTAAVFLAALATLWGARYPIWRSACAVLIARRGPHSFAEVTPVAAGLTLAAVAALFAGAVIAGACALPPDSLFAP